LIYKNKTLFFAAHDAGAAEILVAIAKRNKNNNNIILYLAGPAKEIFTREEFDQNKNILRSNLEKEIFLADYVITGTSLGSSHELEVLSSASKYLKKTGSILDHWTNYKERFLLDRQLILPKEIWVFDSHAKELALNDFEDISVVQHKNLYISDQLNKFQEINNHGSEYVLYLCQNLNDHRETIPFDDLDALSFFLENKYCCDKYSENAKVDTVCIRLHPSQEDIDLEILRKKFPYIKIIQKKELNLLNQISESSYVVGVDTMAMALAIECGKEVFCSIPVQNFENYFNLLPYNKVIKKIIKLKNYC